MPIPFLAPLAGLFAGGGAAAAEGAAGAAGGGVLGKLATDIGIWGVGVPLAGAAVNRMIEGSPESQMRRQMALQAEFEGQQNADAAALEALMSKRAAPSVSELLGEAALMKQVEEASYKLKKARNKRPQYLDELGDIVAGQHARIAALQSERTLSPIEIIQMMEGVGG